MTPEMNSNTSDQPTAAASLVRVNLNVDPTTRRRWKTHAALQGVSMQDLIFAAVEKAINAATGSVEKDAQ